MANFTNPTKVITGPGTRWSYAGMGFNEYVKRKEGKMHGTKKSDDNSADNQPLHGGAD